jgi:phosphohistidine phosphatase
MKTLYLLRHAKSSWADPALADFDRPLNDRGLAAAAFMGELMASKGYDPAIVLCSPAERAKHTALIVSSQAAFEAQTVFVDRIYEASPQGLRQVAFELDDSIQSAMIVGHNPGMEGLITLLTGEFQTMPTAALAVVDVDIDSWHGLNNVSGTLQAVYRPKDGLAKKLNAP